MTESLGFFGRLKYRFDELFEEEVLGLDIGEDTIKLVNVSTSWGKIVFNNVGVIETPSAAVEDGKIKDVEALSNAIQKSLAKNNFEVNKVITAVSGEKVVSRTIEIPNMSEEELDKAVSWEAKEQIPIPIEEGILEYEILNQKANGDYQLLIIVVKQKLIDKYLELFDNLGLEPLAIETEPIAIGRTVNELYKKNTICAIDIGKRTTDVSIIDNGRLLFTRTVNLGGTDITAEIADKHDLSSKDANKYKENNDLFKEPESNLVIKNLITAIYRSLDYFEVNNQDYEIDKIMLTGGSSKLKGLDRHLSKEFDIKVGRLDFSGKLTSKLKRVSKQKLEEIVQLLTVGIGLALRKEEEA